MAATQKTYTIPLRKSFHEAAPLKRTPKAVRAVKAYLIKHCKADEVRIGARLNDLLWSKGITNPPHKVAVDVIVADGVAKAELQGFAYQEAKKIQKKKEPQSFKERIASKIGAPVAKDDGAQPAGQGSPAAEDSAAQQAAKASPKPQEPGATAKKG
ncbi:50S ribosomal protein L31e [Candidatus Woesearchaeota archaeon]|nr:50S ribosomal protein L31e [Candidatus Woesearchaeota archaeon]